MKEPDVKAAGALSPALSAELTATMVEFVSVSQLRSINWKTYGDYVRAVYDVVLEGGETALTKAQSTAVARILEDLGRDLSGVPATPSDERVLKGLEIEGAARLQIRDLLTEAQRNAVADQSLSLDTAAHLAELSVILKESATEQICQAWTRLYQLDSSQQQQAKTAAQAYVDAATRIDAELRRGDPFDGIGSPEHYAYRARLAREHLTALDLLRRSMTSAQQERSRTVAMPEFVILDPKALQSSVPSEPQK